MKHDVLRITRARYLGGYRFEVVFNDGHRGDADLADRLHGLVFGPLKDPELFAQGALDPEAGTIVWPNGADLAPEYLLFRACRNDPALQALFREWGYLPDAVSRTG